MGAGDPLKPEFCPRCGAILRLEADLAVRKRCPRCGFERAVRTEPASPRVTVVRRVVLRRKSPLVWASVDLSPVRSSLRTLGEAAESLLEALGRATELLRTSLIRACEAVGMEVAMEFEEWRGGSPKDVSQSRLGYDIESRGPDGVRYIEVKAVVPGEEGRRLSFTESEYRFLVEGKRVDRARRWVYIVEVDRERLRGGYLDCCIRLYAVRADRLEPEEFSEEAGGRRSLPLGLARLQAEEWEVSPSPAVRRLLGALRELIEASAALRELRVGMAKKIAGGPGPGWPDDKSLES